MIELPAKRKQLFKRRPVLKRVLSRPPGVVLQVPLVAERLRVPQKLLDDLRRVLCKITRDLR
jgi:hypothetical protein